MDLVDIDQVLDNLELREAADENKKLAISERHQYQPRFGAATSNGTASAVSSKPQRSAGSNNGSSNSSNSSNKGFIGVSQVFNSLDDYCKNVESLETTVPQQYDEECRPIAPSIIRNESKKFYFDQNNARECEPPISTDPAKSQQYFAPATKAATISPIREVVNSASRFPEETKESEDEEEICNDIQKFKEIPIARVMNGQDDGEDLTANTTSDSLTTSSSSTFSSGPSPGLASTTDEHSTPLSPVDDDEERSALLATQPGDEQQPDVPTEQQMRQLDAEEQAEDDASLSLIQALNGRLAAGESGAAMEDLAVGLSSISITTANSQSAIPCEATMTVSSVLRNVLDDLSESTSSSLLSQLRDGTDMKAKSGYSRSFATASQSYMEEEESHQIEDIVRILAVDEGHKGKLVPKANSKIPNAEQHEVIQQQQQQRLQQQQLITFSSTMDEISDTELDSMLQEMDIDDVVEMDSATVQANTDDKLVVAPASHADCATAQQAEITATEDAHCTDAAAGAMEDAASSEADNCNADNFSQASTVEFSEIKAASPLQPDQLDQTEVLEGSPNSVASSYTSTESSLDENDLMDGAAESEEAYEEQGALARPQRPTTLDLPALQTSLLANAGQTPPGGIVVKDSASAEIQHDNHAPTTEEQESTIGKARSELNDDSLTSSEVAAVNEVDEAYDYSNPHAHLGKIPPIWVPDNMVTGCMQCQSKFTMIKRRHHCRACGKVLCSVCCSQKFKLDFLANPESRVCVQCYLILTQQQLADKGVGTHIGADAGTEEVVARAMPNRSPNPNNPMEYCSTIPPHRQISASSTQPPPAVIVPVGVLKKDGSYSSNSSNSSGKKARKRKSVMFSDGIAPGSELASTMESQWGEAKHARRGQQQGDKQVRGSAISGGGGSDGIVGNKPPTPVKVEPSSTDATTMGLVAQLFRGSIPPLAAAAAVSAARQVSTSAGKNIREAVGTICTPTAQSKADAGSARSKRLPPSGCDEQGGFIPQEDNGLPPIYVTKDESGCDFDYKEVSNNFELMERLQRETLKFALANNFFVHVKIVNLKCCMNRTVINFTTAGMHHVGNDEIIILLEYQPPASRELMSEPPLPKDIFVHLHEIYCEADQGTPIAELSYTSPRQSSFLGSREYGGFIFIRATFQCLQDVIVPENPFLIGILIHRYEVPWAKVFPLRLMLRLGAQYRYYPCPHISIRNRESVYAEIAQTIISFLADFRNYSYTLPCIRGMYIHMEDRQTTVMIPRNRLDEVTKAINNCNDHILAFGGNFSKTADGHLVCMQNVNDERNEMYAYSTQAINIQGQPRKVTGASFFVLNESLKSNSGLSGKCSIVEDGLMVQIMPAKLEEVRKALCNQNDIDIICGPLGADEQQTEIVSIKWVENDRDFNIGVKSPIDEKPMEGVSSMRVHASFNYSNANYSIRLTDIYILKYENWYNSMPNSSSSDVTRITEQIARSASLALVPFLDLLAASGSVKIGLRATLHQDNVCYEAGTRGSKLPPLYMNALDDHLVPTLHGESSGIEDAIILELIFYILSV